MQEDDLQRAKRPSNITYAYYYRIFPEIFQRFTGQHQKAILDYACKQYQTDGDDIVSTLNQILLEQYKITA